MERRKAFAAAGAVSATALVGVLALGANIGLFGLTSRADGPGKLQIVDASEVVPVTTSDGGGGGSSDPSTSSGVAGSSSASKSPSTTHGTSGGSVHTTAPTSGEPEYEHEDEPEDEPEYEHEDEPEHVEDD